MKEAAKKFDIEKYVLLEWKEIPSAELKDLAYKAILEGKIVKRETLKRFVSQRRYLLTPQKVVKKKTAPKESAANKKSVKIDSLMSLDALKGLNVDLKKLSAEELIELLHPTNKRKSTSKKVDKKVQAKAVVKKVSKNAKVDAKASKKKVLTKKSVKVLSKNKVKKRGENFSQSYFEGF